MPKQRRSGNFYLWEPLYHKDDEEGMMNPKMGT